MLIKNVHRKVLRNMNLPLSVKIVKNGLYCLFTSHLQTHPHLVLKIYLNVVAKVATKVNFHLQGSINSWEHFGTAFVLMGQLRTHVATI